MAIEVITPLDRDISFPRGQSPDIDLLENIIRGSAHIRRLYPQGEFDITNPKWTSHRAELIVHQDGSGIVRAVF